MRVAILVGALTIAVAISPEILSSTLMEKPVGVYSIAFVVAMFMDLVDFVTVTGARKG